MDTLKFKSSLTESELELLVRAFFCFFSLIRKYCFVPGKVEQWTLIVDMGGKFSMRAMGMIKQVTKITNVLFTCCLEKNYIVNAPYSIYLGWKVMKGMINPVTVKKIRITKNLQEIQQSIPSHQLETKYGGTLPNVTSFWPP